MTERAWLERCRAGAREACVRLASASFEVEPALSTEAHARACLAGDGPACELMGHRLVEGLGVAADFDAGIDVLRATCRASPTECTFLALQFEKVRPEEALAASMRGCHAGNRLLCLKAGELAQAGVSGASSLEAAAWLDAACQLGHRQGCAALLELAASGDLATSPDALEAVRRRACRAGVRDACGGAP